jgi:hypothetical protein
LEKVVSATDDHELQSELWLFLNDYPDSTVDAAYQSVVERAWAAEIVYKATKSLISVSPRPHSIEFLASLEPVERSVATLMMIGVPLEAARLYKGLSYIRYNQVVSAIAASKSWSTYVEEETKLRRARRIRL